MEHLDEGTIHAWLDGALSPDEGLDIERHIAECATCAASVAEARGFIAAASRILTALDDVPRGVVPVPSVTGADGATSTDDLSAARARRQANATNVARRRNWWRHPGFVAAAAAAFIAAGSFPVVTRWGMERAAPSASAVAPASRGALEEAFDAARVDSTTAAVDAVGTSQKAESIVAQPSSAQPAPGREADARRKESSARVADASPSPASTAVANSAIPVVAPKALDEMKIGPAVPLGRAGVLVDTGPARRLREAESRQRLSLEAVTVTGGATAAPRAGARDSSSARALVSAAPPRPNEAISERDRLRAQLREDFEAAAPLVGCFVLRLVAVGGGPMSIAAVRLPTRVALDSARVVGSADVQYEARDISPPGERVPATYRWRPTGSASFDFLIIRDGGTQSFAAVDANQTATTGGPVTPTPAGASVRLAATRERCR